MQPTHHDLAVSSKHSYEQQSFSVNDCEVLITNHQNYQIIAVRGTEASKLISGLGILDIIRDARFFPTYNKVLGWCHSGFKSGAVKIANTIDDYIDKNRPVVLTGHSLGAAMALLLSILLKHKGYDVVEYVGFACPRAFVYNKQKHNKDKSVRFPITIYRYENDLVPLVPIWFPFGYHHPVEMIQIGDGNGIPTLSDHPIENYIKSLNRLL